MLGCRHDHVHDASGAAPAVHDDDLDDAARLIVHRHEEAGPGGYAGVRQSGPGDRLLPRYAPEAFAFALNELAEL